EREGGAQRAREETVLEREEAFSARLKARASHAAQVQSRVKKLDKIEKIAAPRRRETLEFEFRPAPRSGDDVVRLSGVDKAWGERVVFRGLDLLIRRRERWCGMGANGAGKSTLLKLVAGVAQPDAGSVVRGAAVVQGYFAQHSMELLDGDQTVWETLEHAFPHATVGSLRTLAAAFGFPGDDTAKRC